MVCVLLGVSSIIPSCIFNPVQLQAVLAFFLTPPFWKVDQAGCFLHMQRVLANSKNTGNTSKFQLAVANHDFTILQQVADVASAPGANRNEYVMRN